VSVLKQGLVAIAMGAAVLAGVPVHAQSPAADMTQAEVRKVDKENSKITLKHGEIKNLDMPPMTMVFQVSQPGALDKLKAGDKVRFRASNKGGQLTASDIQPAR
jgi:Cu/Ag efflux protein CusF